MTEIAKLHEEYVLAPMQSQLRDRSLGTCNPLVFEVWAQNLRSLYRTYHSLVPHAESAIRLTLKVDPKFGPFVATLGISKAWPGKTWEDYLRLPSSQLELYIERLEELIATAGKILTSSARNELVRLQRALGIVRAALASCQRLLDETVQHERLQSMEKRIHTMDSTYLERINLLSLGRKLLCEGHLAMRVNGSGPWIPIYSVLTDNYLFWAKAKASRSTKKEKDQISSGGKLWILEEPIAVSDLAISLPTKDNQFVKTSFLDDVPRGSILYQLFIRSGTSGQGHSFGAFGLAERQQWTNAINAALPANTV